MNILTELSAPLGDMKEHFIVHTKGPKPWMEILISEGEVAPEAERPAVLDRL